MHMLTSWDISGFRARFANSRLAGMNGIGEEHSTTLHIQAAEFAPSVSRKQNDATKPMACPSDSHTRMAEELSDFPAAFAKADPMPWDAEEETGEPVLWPFGATAGTPLKDFNSRTLLRYRELVERKNGGGSYFQPLLDAIDTVLTERQGE